MKPLEPIANYLRVNYPRLNGIIAIYIKGIGGDGWHLGEIVGDLDFLAMDLKKPKTA